MRLFILLLVILPVTVCAQISFDFESGNAEGWFFPSEGRWNIDSGNSLSGFYSLHHSYDNPESGYDIASFPIFGLSPDSGEATWEFRIMHSYNPSSLNNWGFCLLSSDGTGICKPGSGSDAYFAGVNLKGSDDTLRLWKQCGETLTVVISSGLNWENDIGTDNDAYLRVVRTVEGIWRMYLLDELHNGILIGEGFDPELFDANYAGIYYSYSSTRDRLIWIDDILVDGQFVVDNSPPTIIGSDFYSTTSIILSLDESLPAENLANHNYYLEPSGQFPVYVSMLPGNCMRLDFSEPLQNKTVYTLKIDTLKDLIGNLSAGIDIEITLAYPEPGDIIISEIMSDPYPAVEFESEYIEIYNRSEYIININSISLINGNSEIILPFYKLNRGESLAICDIDKRQFFPALANVIGLKGFPALNNSSAQLLLVDTLSYTIHGINYNADWGNDVLKSEGGWSLEIIDTDYPFSGKNNWAYSVNSKGGSPGQSNSVSATNIDTFVPEVKNIFPSDNKTVIIIFSEPVRGVLDYDNDRLIDNIRIENIIQKDSLWSSYMLFLQDSLIHGKVYTALLDEVRDFAGNLLDQSYAGFGLTENILPGDIKINELLFDAVKPEEEYFELYNTSGKILNVFDLQAVSLNIQSGDTGKPVILSETPLCFLPDSYFAFTLSEEAVLYRYFSSDRSAIIEQGKMPVLYSDQGSLLLYNRNLSLIDIATYNKDYHFDLLTGTKGISLERIDPDVPGNVGYNWHSASGMAGWGTPGVENSVAFIDEPEATGDLIFSSTRISPDGDGYEDILKISFNSGEGTSIINVIIYSDTGVPVNRLINNFTAQGSSSFYWNGRDQYGNSLPEGLYIVFVRSRSETGRTLHWKKVCALVRY